MGRKRRLTARASRRKRMASVLGWLVVVAALGGYLVNEFTVDLPPIHYGMLALMFAGGWLGLRHLR